jgi:serine/threonine protein kinase
MITRTPHYFISLCNPVGLGRSGAVFKGRRRDVGGSHEPPLPNEVAVKRVDYYENDPSVLLEIKNEVAILAELDHPNIVKCCCLHEDDRYHYVFFEFFSGGNLYNRIFTKKHFTEEQARQLCMHLLPVLEYLHYTVGLVHRDLKPENIMFESPSENADIKLIDFGFAVFIDDDGFCPREVLGTQLYMAPEIWRREPYGRPVDMWSLGVIVHMMLCGRPPFPADIPKLAAEEQMVVDFPEAEWDGISATAKSFVQGLLCQQPQKRLTATEAADHAWVRVINFMSCINFICASFIAVLEECQRAGSASSAQFCQKSAEIPTMG